MNNIMGVVFASNLETKLNELTIRRTPASLPFCGRYRLIDFTLSNFVNSGITSIGILTKNNYNSLMEHIRMGRDWDLNRKNSGIAMFPPYAHNQSKDVYKDKIEAIYSIFNYLVKTKEEYAVITDSNIVTNIDYEDVYNYHIKNGADITMVTYDAEPCSLRRIVVETDSDMAVKDMYISTVSDDTKKQIGLNIYLMKKDLLKSLIENAYARGLGDFEKDILFKKLGQFKIMAYKVNGYAEIIDDIKGYFKQNMKMLDYKTRKDLFYKYGKIMTKVKDSVPTVYGDKANVSNSLIADGCIINGTVENSVLFRGVKIEEGAVIKNSIIMENGYVMHGVNISYAILDKHVTVQEGRNISGYETYPVVIVKDKIV